MTSSLHHPTKGLPLTLTHLVIVRFQKLSTKDLMFCQEVLERRKCIWCNVKSGDFNVGEESVEFFRLEYYFGQRLMAHTLAKHGTTVESNLLVFIPAGRRYAQPLSTRRKKTAIASYICHNYMHKDPLIQVSMLQTVECYWKAENGLGMRLVWRVLNQFSAYPPLPSDQKEQDDILCTDILYCRGPSADLPP